MSALDRDKAISGVYWMGVMSVINVIIKLLITVIISRLLLPSEIGTVSAVMIVVSFAETFCMIGVGPAIIQKKILTNDDILIGNTLNMLLGVSLYLGILVFSPIIGAFVGIADISMLNILSLIFLGYSFSGTSESLLQREMNFKAISIIDVTSLFAYGVVGCIFAVLGFGGWALVFANIIQVLIKSVLMFINKPVKFQFKIKLDSAKELLYFGTGYTLSKVFSNLATQGDYFVVNRTLGSSALGFYNRAYQLLMVPTSLVGSVIDKVLFPLLSRYQSKHDRLRYVFLNINILIAIVTLPITTVSILLGQDLIIIVLGKNWGEAVLPFKILIISLFFRIAYKVCDSLVRSVGEVYKRLWVQMIYALFVVGGAYVGKNWGIAGVAVTTLISIIINYIIMNILISKLIKLKVKDILNSLAPVFVSNIVVGIIVLNINAITIKQINSVLNIFLITFITFACSLVSYEIFLEKVLPEEFKFFISSIIESSKNKIKKLNRRIGNT
jgi:O-antigen/teichoic acid export membrane protein